MRSLRTSAAPLSANLLGEASIGANWLLASPVCARCARAGSDVAETCLPPMPFPDALPRSINADAVNACGGSPMTCD